MSVYLCPSSDTYDACQLLELELARPTCFTAINYRIMAGLRKDRGAASFFSTHLSRQNLIPTAEEQREILEHLDGIVNDYLSTTIPRNVAERRLNEVFFREGRWFNLLQLGNEDRRHPREDYFEMLDDHDASLKKAAKEGGRGRDGNGGDHDDSDSRSTWKGIRGSSKGGKGKEAALESSSQASRDYRKKRGRPGPPSNPDDSDGSDSNASDTRQGKRSKPDESKFAWVAEELISSTILSKEAIQYRE
ncbi:hypothetical protein C8J56DRAFT_888302 [Mycena floridula]|nr:hypothetical protein C8J56DRAFT_888302 [Mycena floridula]